MLVLRKFLLQYIPHVIWLLAASLCYAMMSNSFYGLLQGSTNSAAVYYYKGLLLLVPLIAFSYAVKKAARIWQFLLVGLVLVAGLHLLFGCWFFTAFVILIFLLRGGNRIRQQLQILEEELPEESMLDHPSKFLLAVPIISFLLTGYTVQPFIQEMALYHFVAMAILFFVMDGLQRFEGYVRLSEMNANVPAARILETGTRIFVGCALSLILVLAPILYTQYQFVPIDFSYEVTDTEITEEEKEDVAESDHVSDVFAAIAEEEPGIDLSWLWEILDKVMVVAVYCGSVYALYRLLKMLIVNFNKTQVEKNDVIESTFLDSEASLQMQRSKVRLAELFDFSPAMKIRRRYKKELKKHKPKGWQTPAEMEQMAQKDIPELHLQYEQVRYGKTWR